jgi:hypothetical protein
MPISPEARFEVVREHLKPVRDYIQPVQSENKILFCEGARLKFCVSASVALFFVSLGLFALIFSFKLLPLALAIPASLAVCAGIWWVITKGLMLDWKPSTLFEVEDHSILIHIHDPGDLSQTPVVKGFHEIFDFEVVFEGEADSGSYMLYLVDARNTRFALFRGFNILEPAYAIAQCLMFLTGKPGVGTDWRGDKFPLVKAGPIY